MVAIGSQYYEFMHRCLERATAAASEEQRERLLAMLKTFARGDIHVQKSLSMIAESWELLWRLDRGRGLQGKSTRDGTDGVAPAAAPPAFDSRMTAASDSFL